MQHDFASMRTNSVFDEINALPGSERRLATDNRNRQMSVSQRSTNVRRHVVGAFSAVLEQRIAVGHQASEKPLQIMHDIRVGIFLNQEAR